MHYIAADLGHHLSVAEYVKEWPDAKTIGVQGLERKKGGVRWDFIYGLEGKGERPEELFGWEEMESVLFEGFVTRAVAWLHVESGTVVVSDLVMNLPAREVYFPPCFVDTMLMVIKAIHPFVRRARTSFQGVR